MLLKKALTLFFNRNRVWIPSIHTPIYTLGVYLDPYTPVVRCPVPGVSVVSQIRLIQSIAVRDWFKTAAVLGVIGVGDDGPGDDRGDHCNDGGGIRRSRPRTCPGTAFKNQVTMLTDPVMAVPTVFQTAPSRVQTLPGRVPAVLAPVQVIQAMAMVITNSVMVVMAEVLAVTLLVSWARPAGHDLVQGLMLTVMPLIHGSSYNKV